MTVLKIDQDARRDDRRTELAKILRDAVWGESKALLTLKQISGAVVRHHSEAGSKDPLNDAIATIAEAASLGLIRKVGSYWGPGPLASSQA